MFKKIVSLKTPVGANYPQSIDLPEGPKLLLFNRDWSIGMIEEKFSRHFMVVHTFVSDAACVKYCTPPEKRDPKEERLSEYQWAVQAAGEYAQCMQTWLGNDDFFYCHWVAESEEDVYRQLDAFELEGKVVNSLISEMHQFVTAYRGSDKILRQYPEVGDKW